MNLPDEGFQVDVQRYQCHQFEQLLDDCLDGRGAIGELASNSHMLQCGDCQRSFEVYQQFDGAGGAMLNGGAKTSVPLAERSGDVRRSWLPMASAVSIATAGLILLVLVSIRGGESLDAVSSSDAVASSEPAAAAVEMAYLGEGSEASSFSHDLHDVWNSSYFTELRPAVGHFSQVGKVSQSLLSRSIRPITSIRGMRWPNPWLYTSELPGIRPLHHSVNAVALVLDNESISLL